MFLWALFDVQIVQAMYRSYKIDVQIVRTMYKSYKFDVQIVHLL
jgi:hypothetical protein